ncbi:hypothetical protein VFPPC_16316 [Pochonia chlamydosporia 170]|uniref:Uncharacterized protein n=1 Tax=Pochonia chlamydosporia 170 TaxID=1380566 RepID=A0A179FIF2_METCM|nr:hypothetical protein VFPPC_16316 [Pochonia chlamydosporia 170]OAQ65207.1 hypothetical protein VFPPC_16316 [Pochonia chlamydosporia 170]
MLSALLFIATDLVATALLSSLLTPAFAGMANCIDGGSRGIWDIPLSLTDFNVIVALLGGFISLFGLVSYLLKENYYLSEARESFLTHTFLSFLQLSKQNLAP